MNKRTFKCSECNNIWEVEFGSHRPSECPKCGSTIIHREDRGDHRSHRQRRRQQSRNYGRDRI